MMTFRNLRLTPEQYAQVQSWIKQQEDRGQPWDTLQLDFMLKDMLKTERASPLQEAAQGVRLENFNTMLYVRVPPQLSQDQAIERLRLAGYADVYVVRRSEATLVFGFDTDGESSYGGVHAVVRYLAATLATDPGLAADACAAQISVEPEQIEDVLRKAASALPSNWKPFVVEYSQERMFLCAFNLNGVLNNTPRLEDVGSLLHEITLEYTQHTFGRGDR